MEIRKKYEEFLKTHGVDPKFASASIIWLEDKEQEDGYIFKMSSDVAEGEDDLIFYYCDSVSDLVSLTDEGAEDFVILPETVEFLSSL